MNAYTHAAALLNEVWADRYDAELLEDETLTRTTMAQFMEARQGWAHKGELTKKSASVVEIEGAQAVKGQPRKNLIVVDLGEQLMVVSN